MKKVIAYLKTYQKEHFDWKVYATILVFLAICIAINYRLDFEDGIIDSYSGEPIKWVWMFLFQGGPFLVVCLILYAFNKKRDWLKSKNFWLKFFVGFSLLALDRSFYGFDSLVSSMPKMEAYFVLRCINWSSSLLLVVIPLLILHRFLEKEERNWYGLSWEKFDPKPYLFLLGIASIFIGLGSFTDEIQRFYPKLNHVGINYFYNSNQSIPKWGLNTIFEFCYGTNFISVELLFRGFLIFAFARTLGGYAVLPMVASYAFLHFGKPMGETISSIFGGYVLGIISYNSRNVWGGIFIHLGVAWLMEFFGWLQSLR